jgi:hypothetical protein
MYRYAYVKTTAPYIDTARACGLTAVPSYVCQTSSLSACNFVYDNTYVGSRIDTYDDLKFTNGGPNADDTHRIFFDYNGAQQCYGSSGIVSSSAAQS